MRACDLVADMKSYVGGASFINLSELTAYLNKKDVKCVRKKYLVGLPKVGNGYYIPDVAKAIDGSKKVTT